MLYSINIWGYIPFILVASCSIISPTLAMPGASNGRVTNSRKRVRMRDKSHRRKRKREEGRISNSRRCERCLSRNCMLKSNPQEECSKYLC